MEDVGKPLKYWSQCSSQTSMHIHPLEYSTKGSINNMPFKVNGVFIPLMLASLDTRHINKSC